MELNFIFIFSCIYFYFPVAMANIGANLGKFIPIFKALKYPIDFGLSIKGSRVIGDHKNVGGFLFGILFGSLFGYLKTIYLDQIIPDQYVLFSIDQQTNIFLYIMMSTAALMGDIIKSIFKRILNRPPHSPWIPFDEIDHSLASLIVASFIIPIDINSSLTIIIVFVFLHLLANILGYFLKIKKVPY